MINWFKWFICWFNEEHIFTMFYDKNGKGFRKCIRCGCERGLD